MMLHDTPKFEDVLSPVVRWFFTGFVIIFFVAGVATVSIGVTLGLMYLGWWAVIIPITLLLVILTGKHGVEKWDIDL